MENKELRYNPINWRVVSDAENNDTRTIKGTAIVFNSRSELLNEQGIRFYETITPEAVTRELIEKSDIVMLYNHKKDAGVLARSKNGIGSLRINITDEGVDYEFEAKNTALGNEVLESVKRGDLDSCSFAFYVRDGGDKWAKEGSVYLRTINEISMLTDFSIVINPAYSATNCNSRGLDSLIETEAKAQRLIDAEALEVQRIQDIEAVELKESALEAYYLNLKNIVNSL